MPWCHKCNGEVCAVIVNLNELGAKVESFTFVSKTACAIAQWIWPWMFSLIPQEATGKWRLKHPNETLPDQGCGIVMFPVGKSGKIDTLAQIQRSSLMYNKTQWGNEYCCKRNKSTVCQLNMSPVQLQLLCDSCLCYSAWPHSQEQHQHVALGLRLQWPIYTTHSVTLFWQQTPERTGRG